MVCLWCPVIFKLMPSHDCVQAHKNPSKCGEVVRYGIATCLHIPTVEVITCANTPILAWRVDWNAKFHKGVYLVHRHTYLPAQYQAFPISQMHDCTWEELGTFACLPFFFQPLSGTMNISSPLILQSMGISPPVNQKEGHSAGVHPKHPRKL